VRAPDDQVRVWTKCSLQKDLDGVQSQGELGAKIVENAARKILKGYVPPIAIVEGANLDQAIAITGYEESADIGNLRTNSLHLYELDYSARRIRRLRTHDSVRAARMSLMKSKASGNIRRQRQMVLGS
jgi:hypothetical protein